MNATRAKPKRGRPRIGERVIFALPADLIRRIDLVAREHFTSRADAARLLLEKGLDADDED